MDFEIPPQIGAGAFMQAQRQEQLSPGRGLSKRNRRKHPGPEKAPTGNSKLGMAIAISGRLKTNSGSDANDE